MVMEKKWIKDLGASDCIRATTKEISDKICKKFDELGLKWSDGGSYIEDDYFSNHVDKINYIPFDGTFFFGDYEESICKVYTINDLLDFENGNVAVSDEGYTKEEIELLDRFAGIVLGVALSEFNLANGVSKRDMDIVCNDSYLMAKSMLRSRKEALNNV